MKRALIVGTSHSEGACRDKPGTPSKRLSSGRWHDYLKTDHGYEVVNMSRSNCTAQQQLVTVMSYFMDNPHERFDLCIVEGRSIDGTVSQPQPWITGISGEHTIKDRYSYWILDSKYKINTNKFADVFGVMSSQSDNRVPEYMPYYVDYVHSFQRVIDTWGSNFAMCKYLDQFCDVVRFHTHTTSKEYENIEHEFHNYGWELMKPYCENKQVMVQLDLDYGDEEHQFHLVNDRCGCKHFNEKGHRKLWYNVLYPMYKKYI